MPLYEYNCLDCHEQVELLIRGSEEPHCPECESTRLEKLLALRRPTSAGTSCLFASLRLPPVVVCPNAAWGAACWRISS